MIIRNLQLTNIKSYKDGRFTFEEGVNGICGLNGHGKTTVIEAIGYALYDHMPYRPRSGFVRHGEKNGEVVVILECDDGVEVAVRRRVTDGLLEVRLPHRTLKGEDSKHWLEQNVHTELESFDRAAVFFQDMVGVPQGTFTAIFLETDSTRRAKFDGLLRVEDYRRCFTALLGPQREVEESISQIEKKLIYVNTKMEELPSLKESVEKDEAEGDRLRKALETLASRLGGLEKEHTALEKVKTEMEALSKRASALDGSLTQMAARLERMGGDTSALEEARKKAEQTKKTHASFEGLAEERKALETRGRTADAAARELVRLRSVIEGGRAIIEDLGKQLAEMDAREKDRERTEKEVARSDALVKEVADLRARSDTLRREVETLMTRKKTAPEGNLCPVFEGVRCDTVEDFSKYFKTEIGARNVEIRELDVKLKELGKEADSLAGSRRGLERLNSDRERREGLEYRRKETQEALKKHEKDATALEATGGTDVLSAVEKASRELFAREEQLNPGHRAHVEALAVMARLKDAPRELKSLQNEEKKARKALEDLGKRMGKLSEKYDPESFSALENELRKLREDRSARSAVMERLGSELDGRRRRMKELEVLGETKAEMEAETDRLSGLRSFTEFARETLKGAAEAVAQKFVSEISVSAAGFYSELVEDYAQNLEWDHTYAVHVEDRGARREFRQLSGGEQMAAAISLRLALLKGLGGSDVIFLDEPTQNMDEERRARLSRQIQNIQGFRQVFVITHDDAFGSDYQNLIRLEKVGGESRVVGNGNGAGSGNALADPGSRAPDGFEPV